MPFNPSRSTPSSVHGEPSSPWGIRAETPTVPVVKRANEACLNDLLKGGTWTDWAVAVQDRPERDVQAALMEPAVAIAFWDALAHKRGQLADPSVIERRWNALNSPDKPLIVDPLRLAKVFNREPAWRALWGHTVRQATQAVGDEARNTWIAVLDRMTEEGARWKTLFVLDPKVKPANRTQWNLLLKDGVQHLQDSGYPQEVLEHWHVAKLRQNNVGLSGAEPGFKAYAALPMTALPEQQVRAATTVNVPRRLFDGAPDPGREDVQAHTPTLDHVWVTSKRRPR